MCKELGWSLDFVEHGIGYAKMQMMVMDMPHSMDDEVIERVNVTEENAEDFFGMLATRSRKMMKNNKNR